MNELLERLAKWHEDLACEYGKIAEDEPVYRCHLATAAALRELIDKRDVSKDTLHQLPNVELEHSTDSLLTQAFPAMEDKR